MEKEIREHEAREMFSSESVDVLLSNSAYIARKNFRKEIDFYAPGFIKYDVMGFKNKSIDFPAISITGESCALNCEHCKKHLLKTMIPAKTPEELLDVCIDLYKKGAKGCLISGGADSTGRVPLKKFIDVIKKIKKETNLTLAVHTGIVDEETAKGMASAGVDIALVDVIGDRETLENVYHLNVSPADFENSLICLKENGVKIAPHIVIGLNYGKISGEFHALDILQRIGPDAIVFAGLMPFRDTPMFSVNPPTAKDIAKFIAAARLMFPETPLILGCARNRKDKAELDKLAVRAGINAIAHPSGTAIEEAKKMNLKINFKAVCCAEYAILKEK
ncbi:MAG: radical SAM protein [Euryarchaeota archaeon HGW-Euryarchaeota-1]|nr:MAG: radical SAM protein [Euryarchaeota archaeon HGW-Euryarchaeota-1]